MARGTQPAVARVGNGHFESATRLVKLALVERKLPNGCCEIIQETDDLGSAVYCGLGRVPDN